MLTTWRKEITELLEINGESWADVEHHTLTEEELDMEFYSEYGTESGKPFTLWTKDRVYFPACYDGSEWVASVPRNPCDEITRHIGGG